MGTGRGWWPGPIRQRCPSPTGLSPLRAEAGGKWLPTAARPALTPAWAPSSPRVRPSCGPRGAAASGTACSQPCGPRDLSLSHGSEGQPVPGNFLQFPSLQGLWGKQERVEAPLPSIMSQGQAGLCGRSLSIWAGGSCLPAASTSAGTRDRGQSPQPARASPALDILLFGG